MLQRRPWRSWSKPLGMVFAVAALYVVTARLGLTLALPPAKKATAVWPPSGIALAAVLLAGPRVWPGIWLGAFGANVWDFFAPATAFPLAAHLGVSGSIATGSTLQALLGAALLRRWTGGRSPLDRARSVFRFVGVALLMCLVAATVGVTTLCLAGFAPWANYGFNWWTWWLGDAVGVIVVTPLVLAWSTPPRLAGEPWRLAEAWLLLGVVLTVGLGVFGGWNPGGIGTSFLAYLTVPPLVWAAFRFGQHGATATLLLISGMAVWGTAGGQGPFLRDTLNESLLLLQTFVAVLTVTALALAAVLAERRRAAEELKDLEMQYEDLYEKAPDLYVSVDAATARITRCNQTLVAATGYAKAEVLGRPLLELYHPACREEALRAFQASATTGELNHPELRLRRKDGGTLDVSVNVSAARDEQGRVRSIRTIWRDIGEQKRLEARFRASFESAPTAMVMIEASGRIVLVNAETERLFGYRREELLGQPVEVLVPERFLGAHPDMRAAFCAAPQARRMGAGRDLFGRCKDGSEVPIEIGLNPIATDEGLFVLSAIVDISQRKRAEDAKVSLIAQLQRALSEIKTLRGLIPICAWCKKIRNDAGFWQQIEAYVRDHTEAQFTHGICPECATKLKVAISRKDPNDRVP